MLYDERILSLDKETRFEDETSTLVCGILKNSNEENSSTPIVALLPKQFSMENKQQVIQHYECFRSEDETSTLVCGILKNSNEENSSTPIVALLPKQFSMENKQQVIQHYECL